ncbi:XAC2610-related protein [Flavobacterium sp. P21]|uniref:XAC2610-related protein n=1 Tax=Flavobacterium sp. P21 TaxID=3423948 RepID=UPI003D666FCE
MKTNLTIAFLLLFINIFAQSTTIIKCDSIYKNKGITIKLATFNDSADLQDDEENSNLTITQELNGKRSVLIKENLHSSAQEIDFRDFNNDNIKDILVQNYSDVRSNWTYYLYLYNPKTNTFKKVIGFEEIKNPIFNSKYGIIESHVISGKNWASFYKIKNNKIHDFNIEITDDGSPKSEKEYAKQLKKLPL